MRFSENYGDIFFCSIFRKTKEKTDVCRLLNASPATKTESTVREKMATCTFTYNALRPRTLKERIKAQRKLVSHSNSTRAMLLVWERQPLNHIFLYAL